LIIAGRLDPRQTVVAVVREQSGKAAATASDESASADADVTKVLGRTAMAAHSEHESEQWLQRIEIRLRPRVQKVG